MYEPQPSAEEMAVWGFKESDYAHEFVSVWPENEKPLDIFLKMRTQWFAGMNGASGLRYEALYPLLDRSAKTQEEWDDLFSDIRIMEAEALTAMSQKD